MKKNKNSRLIKASILVAALIFASFGSISTASYSKSDYEEAADYVLEQLEFEKDEYFIHVWGPIEKGEEVFGTKEHIIDAPDDGFIVYIDLFPIANLFHPVLYVFLSEDKEQFIIIDAVSPPMNFDDYQMIETAIGQYHLSVQNRRPTFTKIPSRTSGSADNRYAVLMNGGHSAGSNHVRYWNDLSNIYITLVDVYGFLDENIIVLCSDGLDPGADQSNGQNSDPDLDGDGDEDIMYSCVLDNVDMVLVVLDSARDPLDQVNITILGNLDARNIPFVIVANKVDLKKSQASRVREAFPNYNTIGISAKTGFNVDELYNHLLDNL